MLNGKTGGVTAVATAFILSSAAHLWSQSLSLNLADYRALPQAVRQLRLKTGWRIAIEELVWPPQPAPSAGAKASITAKGNTVTPPAPDALSLPSLQLQGRTSNAALDELLATYHLQNGTRKGAAHYARTLIGDVTVVLPDLLTGSLGQNAPARSLLSAQITIPPASRLPEAHLDAIAQAAGQQMNVAVRIDTAAFGLAFDRAFAGDDGVKSQWGTAGVTSAREALANFLQESKTTSVWEVDCQAGIAPSNGECILSVMPIMVEVRNRNGKLTQKTLYFDRGRPAFNLPPQP